MFNFYDLASRLQEDGGVGSVSGPTAGGATTMNAISYLPTQVGVVRSALSGLKKKKKKWNLEILETNTDRTVCFEDALKVIVPNEHWDHFQQMFDGQLDNSSCFVLSSLAEDSEDTEGLEDAIDLEGRRADVHLALESVLSCHQVRCAQQVYSKWISKFIPDKDLTSEKVLLPLTKKAGVEKLYEKLIESCSDDRGRLEMLSERLEGEKALTTLQKSSDCTILAGARIHSMLDGIGVIFEARVGFDKNIQFSVLVEDDEVADRLQESMMSGARRLGNVFYFRAGHFECKANVSTLLVEAIHDAKDENHE